MQGGQSVTYRSPSNKGTRFEWFCGSQVDGGSNEAANPRCVGASTKSCGGAVATVGIYGEAWEAWVRYDTNDSVTVSSDELRQLLQDCDIPPDGLVDEATLTFPEFIEDVPLL